MNLNYQPRGNWNEIILSSLPLPTQEAVKALVEQAAETASTDEHGSWDFGCAFDKRGRGEALNWDLYGIGRDYHSGQHLIVIQVRQATVGKRWTNVRKNYFLIGYNEDDTAFAHAVSANVVRSAINRGTDVIRACQDWMFGCDYATVLRQGDLALIPIRSPRAEAVGQRDITLENTHYLITEGMRFNGDLYVFNPVCLHLNGTHPVIEAQGWYKVAIGQRAATWAFASPTAD
jgi:hypothetical protein